MGRGDISALLFAHCILVSCFNICLLLLPPLLLSVTWCLVLSRSGFTGCSIPSGRQSLEGVAGQPPQQRQHPLALHAAANQRGRQQQPAAPQR
jgi:hypothetical protein